MGVKFIFVLIVGLAFLSGFMLATNLDIGIGIAGSVPLSKEKAIDISEKNNAKERASPFNWLEEKQIIVTSSEVRILLQDAAWSTFTDTNSMDPVIDKGANAIEIHPKSEEDIHVGDIVAYESEQMEGAIIHRVIAKGQDQEGVFYILKGDNNKSPDPGKIRFSQIKRVVVGILY